MNEPKPVRASVECGLGEGAETPRLGPVDSLAAWNIVLLGDDEHSYNYITRLLTEVFHLAGQRAVDVAAAVAEHGRAVCWTGHREYAEFKREQVAAFGHDALMERLTGPMCVVLERV